LLFDSNKNAAALAAAFLFVLGVVINRLLD